MTEQRVDVNGISWFFREGGPAGRPVVLIHGAVVSGHYMLPTARALMSTHRVLVPDLPGFGRSGRPPTRWGIEALADGLADWIAAVAPAPVDVVANSYGCQITAALAIRHPSLVRSMVWVGPTIEPVRRRPGSMLARLFLDAFLEPGMVPIFLRDFARAGLRQSLWTFRAALRDTPETRLPQIGQPTLVLRGERDPLVSNAWAAQVAALLPDGRLRVLPGAAHAINFSVPAMLAAEVRRFMA